VQTHPLTGRVDLAVGWVEGAELLTGLTDRHRLGVLAGVVPAAGGPTPRRPPRDRHLRIQRSRVVADDHHAGVTDSVT
jgi:hypothetical protein